jgi:predicted nucleic acid-binding protein
MMAIEPARAREVIRTYQPWIGASIGTATLLLASEIAEPWVLSFWHGPILAAAAEAGAAELVSEDLQREAVIAGVQIRNPFVAAAPGA